MKLYHGSNTKIEKIDLSKCKPYKDFGQGFYLTEIKEQAEQMAKRTATIYGGEPTISEFEFNESGLTELSVKQFDEPNEEWALFVLANRSFDIVIGPVADDDIAQLFRNFNDGYINLAMLVEGLKYKKISSQYFFHTETAIKYLKVYE